MVYMATIIFLGSSIIGLFLCYFCPLEVQPNLKLILQTVHHLYGCISVLDTLWYICLHICICFCVNVSECGFLLVSQCVSLMSRVSVCFFMGTYIRVAACVVKVMKRLMTYDQHSRLLIFYCRCCCCCCCYYYFYRPSFCPIIHEAFKDQKLLWWQ